jgi:hypothetical protein
MGPRAYLDMVAKTKFSTPSGSRNPVGQPVSTSLNYLGGGGDKTTKKQNSNKEPERFD